MEGRFVIAAGGASNDGHGRVWLAVLLVIVWLGALSGTIRREVKRRRRLRQGDRSALEPSGRRLYAWLYLSGLVVWWGSWAVAIILMIVNGVGSIHGPLVAALFVPMFISCMATVLAASAARWRAGGLAAGPGPRASQAALTGAFVLNAIQDLHRRPPQSGLNRS